MLVLLGILYIITFRMSLPSCNGADVTFKADFSALSVIRKFFLILVSHVELELSRIKFVNPRWQTIKVYVHVWPYTLRCMIWDSCHC